MTNMFKFIHNYIPDPVLLKFGPFTIHWYGFFIILGFLLGLFLALKLVKQYNAIDKKVIYDISFYGLLFGIIGDRIYYVLYAWELYRENLWDVIKIWEGGLAIHGGIIAGILVLLVYARRSASLHQWGLWIVTKGLLPGKTQNATPKNNDPSLDKKYWGWYFWFLADIIIVILLAGLAIGRFGNYFNQELFGRPTNLPWGIPIETRFIPVEYTGAQYFHPTFLYESLADLLILGILFILHARRVNALRFDITDGEREQQHISPRRRFEISYFGNIALLGIALYSIVRFLNEFLRIDYSPLAFGIRWAQIVSVLLIAVCMSVWFFKRISKV